MEGGGAGDPPHAQDGAARAGERRGRAGGSAAAGTTAGARVWVGAGWPPCPALPLRPCCTAPSLPPHNPHLAFGPSPPPPQVGTTSVEKSEILAGMLDQEGIPYQVPTR